MTKDNDDNAKHVRWPAVTALILPSFLAGGLGPGVGSYVYFRTQDPAYIQEIVRPDPATGAELRALAEVVAELRGDIQRHTELHPDRINRSESRISALETQIAILMAERRVQ